MNAPGVLGRHDATSDRVDGDNEPVGLTTCCGALRSLCSGWSRASCRILCMSLRRAWVRGGPHGRSVRTTDGRERAASNQVLHPQAASLAGTVIVLEHRILGILALAFAYPVMFPALVPQAIYRRLARWPGEDEDRSTTGPRWQDLKSSANR